MRVWRWCVVAVLTVSCTKLNPEVCCIDADDCASIGVSDPVRECSEGLACVDHSCQVPSCSTEGCGAEAPVCDITTDVCTGCTTSTDCDQFPETAVCNSDSGTCVECVGDPDCPAARPVCSAGACRTCTLDSECPSGACGDGGACVEETNVVYVAPQGTDAGTCARNAPCKQLKFALSNTSVDRNHIVMAPGAYTEQQIGIAASVTPALELFIHGGGATLSSSSGDGQTIFTTALPTTIRDLDISFGPFGRAISATNMTVIERVSIRSEVGVEVRAAVTARDVRIESTATNGVGIRVQNGSLTLDRATISGGANGIRAESPQGARFDLGADEAP